MSMDEVMDVYDVALWLSWPSLCPEYVGYVQALSAFTAIEYLMCVCRVSSVVCAAADALDGSLRYQAWGVRMIGADDGTSGVWGGSRQAYQASLGA